MPYYNAWVQVERNAIYYKLQSKIGIVVMWNGDDAVMVKAYKYALYLLNSMSAKNRLLNDTAGRNTPISPNIKTTEARWMP